MITIVYCRGRCWGSERLSNLSSVTQLGSSGAKIQTQEAYPVTSLMRLHKGRLPSCLPHLSLAVPSLSGTLSSGLRGMQCGHPVVTERAGSGGSNETFPECSEGSYPSFLLPDPCPLGLRAHTPVCRLSELSFGTLSKVAGMGGRQLGSRSHSSDTPLMDLGGRLLRATAFQGGLKPAGPVEAAHMCIFQNLQIHPPGQGYMVGQAYPFQAPHR